MVKNTASGDVRKSLENTFQIFNEFAENLTASYRTLEERIGQLNQELLDAHNERLEQLNEKERYAERLSAVLAALPAGVVVIDGRGVIQECNPVSVKLLGEPLQGELWRDIIQREFTGASQGSDMQLKNGRVVSFSTCPLGNEPGQIVHLLDVTENRVLQNALGRYKRLSAMGEMTAKLAHQIRTPLSSALLYSSHLAKQGLDEASQKKFSGKLISRLKHLEKVVEDMLAFTRGSTGQNREVVSIESLLDSLRRNCEPSLEDDEAALVICNSAENIDICVNQDAILSVMQNLVDNALQVCDHKLEMRVEARCVTQHADLPAVDLIFTDNGPGIPDDYVQQIFEPYFTTRAQGTGLGLAIARTVVEGHGGSMWLENTSDQGASFVMRLPIHQDIPEENRASETG